MFALEKNPIIPHKEYGKINSYFFSKNKFFLKSLDKNNFFGNITYKSEISTNQEVVYFRRKKVLYLIITKWEEVFGPKKRINILVCPG